MEQQLDVLDVSLRLLAAVAAGLAVGFDREWRGKPIGLRTLALVSLGSALVCLATTHLTVFTNQLDALSRVIQGVIQGVMAGIGFLGAGAIIYRRDDVHGLTTAATAWVTAALGIACALADWSIVLIGAALTLFVLIGLTPLEKWIEKRRPRIEPDSD